jgi:hypothetical protein
MCFHRSASRFAWVTVFAVFAAHAADAGNASALPVTQVVSRIAGSLLQPSTKPVVPSHGASQEASPSVQAVADEPGDADDIKAVCLTSGSNLARCGAAPVAKTTGVSGCQESSAYDAESATINEPSSWCHGRTQSAALHAPHVAVCDVDDVGLAKCLEKYAASLVKHADVAKRVYQFANNNDARIVTVLATAKQTERDAKQMAAGDITTAAIIPMH